MLESYLVDGTEGAGPDGSHESLEWWHVTRAMEEGLVILGFYGNAMRNMMTPGSVHYSPEGPK